MATFMVYLALSLQSLTQMTVLGSLILILRIYKLIHDIFIYSRNVIEYLRLPNNQIITFNASPNN